MKIAIIDLLGLCYDGNTLKTRGLGGSESAVILMSRELAKLGHEVTVFNNCIDSQASPGFYDGVEYIDHSTSPDNVIYDIAMSSRTVKPFFANNQYGWITANAKKKVLWMHDTFCEGDEFLETLLMQGYIDEVFTLSDFHSWYVTSCEHGNKRNFEVLKHKFFQTRNGAVTHINEVDLSKKDPNHFVYNASATKGLIPLVTKIWPEIRKAIPNAHLTCIGGFYRFREGAEPDAQEKMVNDLVASAPEGVHFTGVIPQYEIAEILANATLMLYPTAFPETFGISSLESLLYKTPIVTNTFGALEETAVEKACYKIPYSSTNNALFRNINEEEQAKIFIQTVINAHSNRYLLQQKQNYCDVVKDVSGWDTVALEWDQHFHKLMEMPYDVVRYRKARRISEKVARIFGRRFSNPEDRETYTSYGIERHIVVVSPFWNAENFIERHIRSVAQQDYGNYTHVLIDDASDDNGYEKALEVIKTLPEEIQDNFIVHKNDKNMGCIYNQLNLIDMHTYDKDVIMLLDGDDYLANNPTLFHYYNDLYDQEYEFTYGSMWSMVDNIPLIAQEYPESVKANKSYREHMFNWKIPYTHLRTCLSQYFKTIDKEVFKVDGKWMKSGADNPLFYELIEQIDPDKIYCNREIVCYYNDASPYNDYKMRPDEQNRNANTSMKKKLKTLPNDITLNMILEDWNNGFSDLIVNLSAKRNKVVVQAGGNQGLYPLLLSKHYETVYTFEPNKEAYGVLVENCDSIGNIKHECKGLGQKQSTASGFNTQPENSGKYQLDLHKDGDIEITTIDSLNLEHCDLIWLDTELTEYEVLLGAEQTIRKFKPDVIIEGPETTGYKVNELLKTFGYTETDRVNRDSVFKFEEKAKTILIAVPTNKYIEPETMKSIYDLKVPEGYTTEFQFFYGYQIDQIRNLIAEWAKRYDYLFSVDSDIVLPADSLEKMLKADKDIVSGLYIQRIPNTHKLEIYIETPNGGVTNVPNEIAKGFNSLQEIAGCGFGCSLIKSEIFRNMEYPHFHYHSALNHKDTISEDIYFCQKARGMGYKIWADMTIKCDHIGNTRYQVNLPEESHLEKIAKQDLLPREHANYLKSMDLKPKVVYDIGACVLHWTLKAKEAWPDASYHLIDAASSVVPFLEKSGHPWASAVLSDEDDKMISFYEDSQNPGGNSYYMETTGAYTENHRTERKTITLDTLRRNNNWPLPDLIKMDVQGAELDVLRGAIETLSNNPDIILEAQHVDYNAGAPKINEVLEYMSSIGYECVSNFCKAGVDGDYHFRKVINS